MKERCEKRKIICFGKLEMFSTSVTKQNKKNPLRLQILDNSVTFILGWGIFFFLLLKLFVTSPFSDFILFDFFFSIQGTGFTSDEFKDEKEKKKKRENFSSLQKRKHQSLFYSIFPSFYF